MSADADRLCARIDAAFNRAPPPPEPVADWYDQEMRDDTGAFWGKPWDALCVQDFHDNIYVFTSLPSQDLAYFLGAYMAASLREDRYEADGFGFVAESPLHMNNKTYRTRPKMTLFKEALSVAQLAVFADYLAYGALRAESDDMAGKMRFMEEILRQHLSMQNRGIGKS